MGAREKGSVLAMSMGRFRLVFLVVLAITLVLTACEQPAEDTRGQAGTLTLAFDGWQGSYLPMYVLKVMLEEHHYAVEILEPQEAEERIRGVDPRYFPSDIVRAFEAVAQGHADIFTSAWLPSRNVLFDQRPNLIPLGHLYGGSARDAFEGFMIHREFAEQHGIDHLRDLADEALASELGGRILGCPTDWACANRFPLLMHDYQLSEFYDLTEPESEQAWQRQASSAIEGRGPALVYMIQPSTFTEEDLSEMMWLPGSEPYLPLSFNRLVVRDRLIAEHPKVAKLLSEMRMPGADIAASMQALGDNPSEQALEQAAQQWLEENREQVDAWLEVFATESDADGDNDDAEAEEDALVFAYSPEKEDLFLELVIDYNLSRQDTLPIRPVRRDTAQMLEAALNEQFGAISPDSSIWLDQLDRRWRRDNPDASALVGTTRRFALSPVVIAMRERVAEAWGYPEEPFGWQDLIELAATDPEFTWGQQTATSAAGVLAQTAQFYAASGKQSGLARADIENEEALEFVSEVTRTVTRYSGEPENRLVLDMIAGGGAFLDAFVVQEQLVTEYNLHHDGEPLVAVYPKEGTLYLDHPLVLLNGPWVSAAEGRAFRAFAEFAEADAQQRRIPQRGFRPSDLSTRLDREGSRVTPEYGVNPNEPRTLLPVPPAGVIEQIQASRRATKRPADIYLLVETTSLGHLDKLKDGARRYVENLHGTDDRLALMGFGHRVQEIRALDHVNDDTRADFEADIERLSDLVDPDDPYVLMDTAARDAVEKLVADGDGERNRVIVILAEANWRVVSANPMANTVAALARHEQPPLIYAVSHTDEPESEGHEYLDRLARLGQGQVFRADIVDIGEIYTRLFTLF